MRNRSVGRLTAAEYRCHPPGATLRAIICAASFVVEKINMPYSEAAFERMNTDPALRRAYFWQVAQRALLDRRANEGGDAMRLFGRTVLDNLDALVKATATPRRSVALMNRLRTG